MPYWHGYVCDQSKSPDRASKQSTRSVPPISGRAFGALILFVSAAVTKSATYTFPSATAGPEYPPAIFFSQRTFGPATGNLSSIPVSRHTESRFGPSHWGQSSARAVSEASTISRLAVNGRKKDIGSSWIQFHLNKVFPPIPTGSQQSAGC